MLRGIYTATSGMISYEKKQQLLTNNLANALTPGFKQEQAVFRGFPEMLLQQMNGPNQPMQKIGTIHNGTYMQEGIPFFVQGDLRETGKRTDFALNDNALPVNRTTNDRGTLLFAVQHEGGLAYTRNGEFTLDEQGFLTTSSGHYVLDNSSQRIRVNAVENLTFENGQLKENDEVVAQLWIGYTEDPAKLRKMGNSLLSWDGANELQPVLLQNSPIANDTALSMNTVVKQGFLEQSNVDVTKTMTDMMSAYRMYEANQKVLQTYDRSLEKTVNEIGKVY